MHSVGRIVRTWRPAYHSQAAGAPRPAAVILIRTTSIVLPPAFMLSRFAVASPSRTRPAIMSLSNPWASTFNCASGDDDFLGLDLELGTRLACISQTKRRPFGAAKDEGQSADQLRALLAPLRRLEIVENWLGAGQHHHRDHIGNCERRHQHAPPLSADSVLGEQVDAGACASNRDRRGLAAEALGNAVEEALLVTLGPAAEQTPIG